LRSLYDLIRRLHADVDRNDTNFHFLPPVT
jgi:hypothetical protein